MSNLRRRFVLARAAEKDDFDDDDASSKLAPSTPTSAHGEMLEYILSTEPDSFEGAMESVLEKLSDEVDATKALEENNNNNNKQPKSEEGHHQYQRRRDVPDAVQKNRRHQEN